MKRSAAAPWPRRAQGERASSDLSHRLDEESPVRTPGKIDKPLWAPAFGGPAETKKARSVVASSRVPRWAGFAGSPPAAGLLGAVDWPLVQIPADRHATTGTCVLGKRSIWANRARAQGLSCARAPTILCRDEAAVEIRATRRRNGSGRPGAANRIEMIL